jgi:hypothetical protein
MTNTNCLDGIACPTCGNDFRIYIQIATLAVVTDDGAETFGDMDWDDSSYAECPDCKRHGTLSEFRPGTRDANTNTTEKEKRP